MKNRNTLQRRLVLETVQRMHNHPTAEEIFREISSENTLISKATVYRNLKILSEQERFSTSRFPMVIALTSTTRLTITWSAADAGVSLMLICRIRRIFAARFKIFTDF